MSSAQSSYFAVDDPQWLCMVTLFIASLVTLLLYLAQYFQLRAARWRKTAAEDNAAKEEAASLLRWALSLNSWKSQWRSAWCSALNAQSREKSGSPFLLTFDEDDLEASEFVVQQVFHCKKSAQHKLDLLMQEADDEVNVSWGVSHLKMGVLQVTPAPSQDDVSKTCVAEVKEQLKQVLCKTCPSVLLKCEPAQVTEVKETCNRVFSPPKPPRAHDWKLLVKNIRVALNLQEDVAGSINPVCVLQLDDPPQKFNTSVLENTTNPAWDHPFVFELNGRSKELIIQLMNDVYQHEDSLLGQVSVPFDLVKKQPKGQQTFSLMTKDVKTGSLTTDFTYLDPNEVRSWQPPTPASTKRVEMDRTVMPCGTVVTTITAVKSKPGRLLPPGLSIDSLQKAQVHKPKLSERHVSEQTSLLGSTVSKVLSSSDTELLMLNGTDPVAEAAIKQLHQSAKQTLRSPVKKSTIIISGIAKTPMSQDEELALMAGYAAAMDASMSDGSSSQDVTTAVMSGNSSPPEMSENEEGPGGMGGPPVDWENHTGEDLNHTSISMCVPEVSCKKRRGSFLRKSAKLFFRRRHQRKDPGMSQSHNDLVYLDSTAVEERASKTATLSRMLSRRSKSKSNGSTSTGQATE
ncbi:C2 domain-containing protein 2 isoform X2 [Nerophis ophidion]|uniref:C2 domain-containing protein 2 isoform X2 n=1 Tax=Nerophis ophidion TaxID=159077 RepID=UPI002AE023F1|nr:C2 domain-containing protein 2 isoform X2 [Nerophis ophidion]